MRMSHLLSLVINRLSENSEKAIRHNYDTIITRVKDMPVHHAHMGFGFSSPPETEDVDVYSRQVMLHLTDCRANDQQGKWVTNTEEQHRNPPVSFCVVLTQYLGFGQLHYMPQTGHSVGTITAEGVLEKMYTKRPYQLSQDVAQAANESGMVEFLGAGFIPVLKEVEECILHNNTSCTRPVPAFIPPNDSRARRSFALILNSDNGNSAVPTHVEILEFTPVFG